MSDTVMIEVPTTARMLACCAGIAADGHEPKPAKPGSHGSRVSRNGGAGESHFD